MRAHSLRRTLWFGNVLLGAGVVGLATWLVLDVMPAAADPAKVKAEFAARELDHYMSRPSAAPQQNAPVTMKDVESIDRPEYARLTYWIFSGPMPPENTPESPKPDAPPPPTGLEALGSPASLIYMQPEESQRIAVGSVLRWRFRDQTVDQFNLGKFIRQRGQPDRFMLVDVRRPVSAVSLFEIVYDVYDDPKAVPSRTGLVLRYDATPWLDPKGPIQHVAPDAARAAAGPPGPGEKGTPGGTAVVPSTPRAGTTGSAPAGREATREELQPDITEHGADRVDVDFDQTTYDFVRGKTMQSLAEKVKTMPATDPRTGRPLGLKITGIEAQSPADRFRVKPGDILVSVNGQRINDREELIATVQRMPSDTSRVSVVIDRNGKMITFNIDPRDPKTRRDARNLAQPR